MYTKIYTQIPKRENLNIVTKKKQKEKKRKKSVDLGKKNDKHNRLLAAWIGLNGP